MTSTAKTVLFWITTFLTAVLLYRTALRGSNARPFSSPNSASAQMHAIRVGPVELLMLMIFVIAVIVFAPLLTDRQRLKTFTAKFDTTFNKTFFVVLTVIFAIFTLAEVL